MASNAPCLTAERINEVIFEAEDEALEGLQGSKNWTPGKIIRGNNSYMPKSPLERVLFDKIQEMAQRCYDAGKEQKAGGSRKKSRRNKSRRARS